MLKLVHSGPKSSRQGDVAGQWSDGGAAISHSTRTWWRACSGTRAAHHRCTRATSSSGKAIGSAARTSVAECVECGVEALLTPPGCLMVGFRGHVPDQLVQFVVNCGENDALAVGAHGEQDALAAGVEQPQVPQR
jgi:hypothetical protein